MKRVHELFLTQKRFDIIMKHDGYKEALKIKWEMILYFIQNSLCDFDDIEKLVRYYIYVGASKEDKLSSKERNIHDELYRWEQYKRNAMWHSGYHNPLDIHCRITDYNLARKVRRKLVRMINNYYNYICSLENLQSQVKDSK